MFSRLQSILAPPTFPDDEIKTRQARLLNVVLLLMLAVLPLLMLGDWLGKSSIWAALLDIPAFGICLLWLYLMHRGHVKMVGYGLMISMFILLTAGIVTMGTIRSPDTAGYLVIIVIVGLLFSSRVMLIMALFCILHIIGLAWAENARLLPQPASTANIAQVIAYLAYIILIVGIIHTVIRLISRSVKELHDELNERRRIEEELRESQRQLADIISFLPEATLVINTQGQVIAWNRAMEDLTQVKAKDMLGKGNYEHALPFYGHRRPILIDMVLDTRQERPEIIAGYSGLKHSVLKPSDERSEDVLYGETATPVNINGKSVYLIGKASVLRNSKGEIVGAIESVRDVTERKLAQEKFRALAENSLDTIMRFDRQYRHTYVNPVVEKQTGIPTEQFIGKTHAEMGFSEHLTHLREQAIEHVFATAAPYRIEFEMDNKTGLWIDWQLMPELAPDGSVAAVITSGRDITWSKRVEESLRESERRLADIINFLPDPILVINRTGHIIAWNHAMEELTGVRSGDILGKGNYEYALPFYGERRPILVNLVLSPNEEIPPTYSNLHWQGQKLIAELIAPKIRDGELCLLGIAAALRDSRGKTVGAIEVVHDLTELRRGEEQLRQAKLAAEAAQSAAEAANQAKSIFLANMNHELRTPLNAILGFSEVLTRDPTLTASQRENVDIITRSSEHLLALINDVLELSKIEAGRASLQEEDFDLYYMLQGIEEMFRLRAGRKNLTLRFDLDTEAPRYVHTDVNKLRQVLINLLGNAVKFTEHGSITLRVLASPPRPDNEYKETETFETFSSGRESAVHGRTLYFEVQDTGIGISPEEIADIFEAFFQVNRRSSNDPKNLPGAGLGLAISRNFVRMLGGNLTVSSEINRGSIFRFSIPVTLPTTPETASIPLRRKIIGLKPGQPVYRLLIVDDADPIRDVLSQVLSEIGFDVRVAANGLEAVEVFSAWHPHLIWMDIRMPVMDGREATRQIKALPEGKATVIVAVTAEAFEEERLAILADGCDDFLRKPFQHADIFNLLNKHLGVHYIYQEDNEPLSSLSFTQALTPAALAALPIAWADEMERATNQADLGWMLELIDQVRDHPYCQKNPFLLDILLQLANDFDQDTLLAWLKERPL